MAKLPTPPTVRTSVPTVTRFRTREGVPVPSVTAASMREIDRVATHDFGLDLLQMMENAGRALADIALSELGMRPRSALVLAGAGGNGGGGLSAARHLHNRGVDVAIVLDNDAGALGEATRRQLDILLHSGLALTSPGRPAEQRVLGADLVIDALVGYGLDGDLRAPTKTLVELANRHPRATLALDIPTGIDATTGVAIGVAMMPAATVTLALPKTGLADRARATGRIYLADIGIPREVFEAIGIHLDQDPYTARGWTILEPTVGPSREDGAAS